MSRPVLIVCALTLALGAACRSGPRSEAERAIAASPVHYTFNGVESPLGCTVSQLLDNMRGHATFDWQVDVVEAEGEWTLEARGVTQFERAPNAWDISLRPSTGTDGALLAYASVSQGDRLHPDQLATFLLRYCPR